MFEKLYKGKVICIFFLEMTNICLAQIVGVEEDDVNFN